MKQFNQSIIVCSNCCGKLKKKQNFLFCQNCKLRYNYQTDFLFNMLAEKNLDKRKKKEIVLFNRLSSYQEFMNRPYFKDLKTKIRQQLSKYKLKNKTILEVGAGTSEFLDIFAKENSVYALDLNEILLKENKEKCTLVVGDAENLPFADNSFDFIYLVGVLHHLEKQEKALKEIRRVLKKNGTFFISEPTQISLNYLYFLLRKLMILILGKDRYVSLSGCGTPDESFISLKAVSQVLNKEFYLKKKLILPLRMPPINTLEKRFPVKLNNFFEGLSFTKKFGTIIFIQGMKK